MRRTSPSRDNVGGQEESGSAKAAQRSGHLSKPSQPMAGKRLAGQAAEQEIMSDSPLFPRDLDHIRSLLGSPLPPLNSPPLFQPSPRRCTVTSPARPVFHRNHGSLSVGNGGLDSFFPALARMPYHAFDTPTNRGMPMPGDLFTPIARKNNVCEQVVPLLPDASRQHGQPQPQLHSQLPTAKDGDIPKAAPGSVAPDNHAAIPIQRQGMLPGERQGQEALRLSKQVAHALDRVQTCSAVAPGLTALSVFNYRVPLNNGPSDSEMGPGTLASMGCAATHARRTGSLKLTIKDMLLAKPDHDSLLPPLVAQPLPLAPAGCEAGASRLRSRPTDFTAASRPSNLPGSGASLDGNPPYAGYRGLIQTVCLPPPPLPALPLLPGLKSGQHGPGHGLEAHSPLSIDTQQQPAFGASGYPPSSNGLATQAPSTKIASGSSQSIAAATNIATTSTAGPAAAVMSGEGINHTAARDSGGVDGTPSTQLPFMDAGAAATATTGLYRGVPSTLLLQCGRSGMGPMGLGSHGLAPTSAATTATVDEADVSGVVHAPNSETVHGSAHEQKHPSACKSTLHAPDIAMAATTATAPETGHPQGERVVAGGGGGRLAGAPMLGPGIADCAAADSPQSSLQTKLTVPSQQQPQSQQQQLQQHVLGPSGASDDRAEPLGGGSLTGGAPDGAARGLKDVAAVPEGLPPRGGALGGGAGALGLHVGAGVGGGNASTPSTLQRPQRTRAMYALVAGASGMAVSGGGVTTPFESGGLGGGRGQGLELDVAGPDTVMSFDAGAGGAARTTGSSGPANRSRRPSDSGSKSCRCKMSQCLKLYCDCFAAERYCGACSCVACHNRPEYADRVQQRREDIAARNPQAFTRKIQHAPNGNGKHKRGCNCRRSHCLKRYCECYQGGVKCGMQCTCLECENMGPASPPDPPGRGKRGGAATKAGRGGALGGGGGSRGRRPSVSTGSMMDDVPPSSPPPPSTSGYSDGPSPAPSQCTAPLSQQPTSMMPQAALLLGSTGTPYPSHLHFQNQPPHMQLPGHHQNQHMPIKHEEMYPPFAAGGGIGPGLGVAGGAPGFHDGDMPLQEALRGLPSGSVAVTGAAPTGMVLDGCSADVAAAKGFMSPPEHLQSQHLQMTRLQHSFQQPPRYSMQGLALPQPQTYMVTSGDQGAFLRLQQQHYHQQQQQLMYSASQGETEQQGQRVVRAQTLFPQFAQQQHGLAAAELDGAYQPAGMKQEPMDGESMMVDACKAHQQQDEQQQAQGSDGGEEGGCGASQPSSQEAADAPAKRRRRDAEPPCGGGSGALGDAKDSSGTSGQAGTLDITASSHSLQCTLQHKQEQPSLAAAASIHAECGRATGTTAGATASGSEGIAPSPLLPAPELPASGATEPMHVNSAALATGVAATGAAAVEAGSECMASLPSFTPRMLGIALDVISPPPLSMLAHSTMLASDSEDCEEGGGCEDGRTLGAVVGMSFVGGRAGQPPPAGMAGALRGGVCVAGRGGLMAMRRLQQPLQQHRVGEDRRMHGIVDTGLDEFADAMIAAIAAEAGGRRGDGGRAEAEQGFAGSCGGDGTPGLSGVSLCGELLLNDGGQDLHLPPNGPNSARSGGLAACFRGSSGMQLPPLTNPHSHLVFPQQHDGQIAGMQLGARGRAIAAAGPAHLQHMQQRLAGTGAGGMMLVTEAGVGMGGDSGEGDILASFGASTLTSCRGALTGAAGDFADNMAAAALGHHPDGGAHYPWSQWLPLQQRGQHAAGMVPGGGGGCGGGGSNAFLSYSSVPLHQSHAWLAPHDGSPLQPSGLGSGGGGGGGGYGVCRNGGLQAPQLSLPLALHGGSILVHGPAGGSAAAGVHTLVSPVRTSATPGLLKRKACDLARGRPDDEGPGGQMQNLDVEGRPNALGEQQQRGGLEQSVPHPSSSPVKQQQPAMQGCTLQIAQLQLPPGTSDMYDTHPYPLPHHLQQQQQQQQQLMTLARPSGGAAAPGTSSAFLSPAPLQQQQRGGSQAAGGRGGPAPGGRGGRGGSAGRGGRGSARQAVADKELLKASALQYITERLAKSDADCTSNLACPSTGGSLALHRQGSLTAPHPTPQPQQQQQLGGQSSGPSTHPSSFCGDTAIGTALPRTTADNNGGVIASDRAPCSIAGAGVGSVATGHTHAVGAAAVVGGGRNTECHPVAGGGPANAPAAGGAAAGSREAAASVLGPSGMCVGSCGGEGRNNGVDGGNLGVSVHVSGGGVGAATCTGVLRVGGANGVMINTVAGQAPMRLGSMTKLGSGSTMFFSPGSSGQLGPLGPPYPSGNRGIRGG